MNKLTFCILSLCCILLPYNLVHSEQTTISVKGEKPIESALLELVGKSVTLKLTEGGEISGKVAEVGDVAVLIKDLTPGMELFNALVNIKNISAIVYRK